MLTDELKKVAQEVGLTNVDKLSKKDLIYRILDQDAINASRKAIKNSVPEADENQPRAALRNTQKPLLTNKKVLEKVEKIEKKTVEKPAKKQEDKPKTNPKKTSEKPAKANEKQPEEYDTTQRSIHKNKNGTRDYSAVGTRGLATQTVF